MNPHALLIALQMCVVSWNAQSYDEAYHQSLESGKPLLVLVGADWCGACQVMKKKVMPQLQRDGALKDIHCTEINLVEDEELANRISIVSTIPCLILFTKSEEKWQKRELIGMHSQKSVKAFIAKHTAPAVASRAGKKITASLPR